MPLIPPVGGLFTDEWDRFQTGVRGLDPRFSGADNILRGQFPKRDTDPATITVPGWDSIIKVGPRPAVTPADWREYFAAIRAGRQPNVDPAVLAEIYRKRAQQRANETAAQPEWARSVGQIMTAIDNVQDFASTIATIGRLLIWAAPRLLGRFVPVVGWVVLAADLLNLMNFFGMVAMPAYALLCGGPKDALLAGVPAAILKNALCRQVWTHAALNPFSRSARAARRLRSMGRLPGIGNLIEVAQVTDTLYGYGLGIGSLYGMGMDALFSLKNLGTGKDIALNFDPAMVSIGKPYVEKIRAMPQGTQQLYQQAARTVAESTVIAGKQHLVDDDQHVLHLAALVAAWQLVAEFYEGGPHQELIEALTACPLVAPARRSESWAAQLEEVATDDGIGRWWLDGNPETVSADRFTTETAAAVTKATRQWYRPRRYEDQAHFVGVGINQLTENIWHTASGGDDRFLKWQLEPDYKLLTQHGVDGLLIGPTTPPDNAWRYWLACRELLDRRGGKLLHSGDVLPLAAKYDVTMVRVLSPETPWPDEWRAAVDPNFRPAPKPAT